MCVCSCVVDPEELREADGEKVFALQFTSIICPPPLSRASSPLPRSTIPLPSHFPIPALRSSLGQKKPPILECVSVTNRLIFFSDAVQW